MCILPFTKTIFESVLWKQPVRKVWTAGVNGQNAHHDHHRREKLHGRTLWIVVKLPKTSEISYFEARSKSRSRPRKNLLHTYQTPQLASMAITTIIIVVENTIELSRSIASLLFTLSCTSSSHSSRVVHSHVPTDPISTPIGEPSATMLRNEMGMAARPQLGRFCSRLLQRYASRCTNTEHHPVRGPPMNTLDIRMLTLALRLELSKLTSLLVGN